MDEIDYDELVHSLRRIVEVFSDEVAPYAKSLCMKLSDAFVRLIKSKDADEDEEFVDEGLTAEGMMRAIRRVLESIYTISEQQPQLYPELEEILEQSLLLCFTEEGQASSEEAINCMSELIYNGKKVTERGWNFYVHLINQYLSDDDYFEESQVSQLFLYLMVRAPLEFKTMNINGQTPLQMLF